MEAAKYEHFLIERLNDVSGGLKTSRFTQRLSSCSWAPHRRRQRATVCAWEEVSKRSGATMVSASSRATSIVYRRQYAAAPASSTPWAIGNNCSTKPAARSVTFTRRSPAPHVVSRALSRPTRRAVGLIAVFALWRTVSSPPARTPARPCCSRSFVSATSVWFPRSHSSAAAGSSSPQCADSSNSGQGQEGWNAASTTEAFAGQNRQSCLPVRACTAVHAAPSGASHRSASESQPQGQPGAPSANLR